MIIKSHIRIHRYEVEIRSIDAIRVVDQARPLARPTSDISTCG
jgi:hypothetical protein